ncbi:N2227-like protein-domain-containing protein [Lineolata rhizophorae]|uniref:carnosine N-methyltransferase n=1 Tax=Lineolata rhizophorae TaxID=578093 RepID=A0A6A6PDH2_9PEZI|nr:N2227-like protein-domain-containing protein [Lineolata rhizophorae]
MADQNPSGWQTAPGVDSADLIEREHILSILDSFYSFRRWTHQHVTHSRRQAFYALPTTHWQLLADAPINFTDTLNAVDDALDANANVAEAIFATAVLPFVGVQGGEQEDSNGPEQTGENQLWKGKANQLNMEKAISTIRQLFRDWSEEGYPERTASYLPVLKALQKEFQHIPDEDKGEIKVLIPGAGLGRLVLEICALGYTAEGNEISYHQLMTSSFILNHTTSRLQHRLYPFVYEFSNHWSRAEQLRVVSVPDISPADVLNAASEGKKIHAFERMSMTAADFSVHYKSADEKEKHNAVTTVYFIDTAPDFITYVKTIHNCLKKNGAWINLGPLLWHFENRHPVDQEQSAQDGGSQNASRGIADPGRVELTAQEVAKLVEHFGFKMEQFHANVPPSTYIGNSMGMLVSCYRPLFFIARKK